MKKWKTRVNRKHFKPFNWLKSTWKWLAPLFSRVLTFGEMGHISGFQVFESKKAA